MIDVIEYFRVNVKKHAVVAGRGYQSRGKGAVIARIHSPDGATDAAVIGESLEYLSENDPLLRQCAGPYAEEVFNQIRSYDPETEIVVLVVEPDGGVNISRTGLIPKHFFQASDQ